jgi:hypothetical protein
MRLLVAEKLYPLCPTTEYHDMPLSEINKCIDRVNNWHEFISLIFFNLMFIFYLFNFEKNPSFPEL